MKTKIDVDKVVNLLREVDKETAILLLSKIYMQDRYLLGEVLIKYFKVKGGDDQ